MTQQEQFLADKLEEIERSLVGIHNAIRELPATSSASEDWNQQLALVAKTAANLTDIVKKSLRSRW